MRGVRGFFAREQNDSDPASEPEDSSVSMLFEANYRVFPITMLHRQEYNYGGKILLPPSCLEQLVSEHHFGNSPLLFRLKAQQAIVHCGVLEFIADEGRMYLPEWMIAALKVKAGDFVNIEQCVLRKGTFVKIEPQSVDFLQLHDPKAALEEALGMFSTLTQGTIVSVLMEGAQFDIRILELEPGSFDAAEDALSDNGDSFVQPVGVSIHETDLKVDFAPPVGYVEPQPQGFKRIGGAVEREISELRKSRGANAVVRVKLPAGKLYIPQREVQKSE